MITRRYNIEISESTKQLYLWYLKAGVVNQKKNGHGDYMKLIHPRGFSLGKSDSAEPSELAVSKVDSADRFISVRSRTSSSREFCSIGRSSIGSLIQPRGSSVERWKAGRLLAERLVDERSRTPWTRSRVFLLSLNLSLGGSVGWSLYVRVFCLICIVFKFAWDRVPFFLETTPGRHAR